MPRDQTITREQFRAITESFARSIKELGRTHRIDHIYQVTANSPAPSFFISYPMARRVVSRWEAGCPIARSRALVSQRDGDLILNYKRIMERNPGCNKDWAIQEAIRSPAPRFYISGKMVAYIISKKYLRCTNPTDHL